MEIAVYLLDGRRQVRFKPTRAILTPQALPERFNGIWSFRLSSYREISPLTTARISHREARNGGACACSFHSRLYCDYPYRRYSTLHTCVASHARRSGSTDSALQIPGESQNCTLCTLFLVVVLQFRALHSRFCSLSLASCFLPFPDNSQAHVPTAVRWISVHAYSESARMSRFNRRDDNVYFHTSRLGCNLEVKSPGTNEFQQRLSFEPGPNFLHSGRPKRAGSAFDGSDLSVLSRDGGE